MAIISHCDRKDPSKLTASWRFERQCGDASPVKGGAAKAAAAAVALALRFRQRCRGGLQGTLEEKALKSLLVVADNAGKARGSVRGVFKGMLDGLSLEETVGLLGTEMATGGPSVVLSL